MVFKQTCLICNSSHISQVRDKSVYYKCKNCGVVFNSHYSALKYDDKYFLDDYKAQYNKTYEEDRENIVASARLRLNKIFKLWKKSNKKKPESLLDIGAALGFFLKTANEYGIKKLAGVEISKYASDYCKTRFNLSVQNTDFENAHFDSGFDLISAWYFVEHCEYPLKVLKYIFTLLNEKGVFAFSIPSFYGPMFTKHLHLWEKTHPEDHSVDFSPRTIRRILKEIGFKKIKVYPAACHAGRFYSEKSLFFPVFKIFYRIITKFSAFSDTIEVYAVK